MKVLFYQKLNSFWQGQIDKIGAEFPEVQFVAEREAAEEHIGDAEVIVGGLMSRELLKGAGALQLIVVPFSGVNHLPFDILREKSVRVANSHGNARYVAERGVAMILAYYGKIVEYHNDLCNNTWHGFWVGRGIDDTWNSIEGKSAAILGAGEIGRYTAQFLQAFGVKTVGFKRTPFDHVPPCYDDMEYDLDKAIDQNDILVVALPATEATKGIINRTRLERMENKLLVNVGRGEIVEEEALYKALKNGKLGGAAIDCWYNYPEKDVYREPSDYPFRELSNVVLSPHIGGFTPQSSARNIEQAFENLRRFLRNGGLLHEVDTDHAY